MIRRACPLHPPFRSDDVINLRLHDDGPGEGLPRPAQVRLALVFDRNVLRIPGDGAVLEDHGRGLAPVHPSLGCHHASLVVHRLPHYHLAVLEHHSRIAEDEVDGAADGAVAVELPVGLGVEGVLVAVHLAVVEDGQVGLHPQSHGLVPFGSC